MSERPSDQDPQLQLRAEMLEHVHEQIGWINEAAEIIGGAGARPDDDAIFPRPPQERRTATEPNWTSEQEQGVREVTRRFGYGAEQTIPSGLPGGVVIAEGGLAWKIAAEAVAFADEANPRTLIFAGSPGRQLRDDEHEFLGKIGETLPAEATEYDLAQLFARRQSSQVLTTPEVLHFGYRTVPGNPINPEPTGQLVHVGATAQGRSVQLLKVEGAIDPENPKKYVAGTVPKALELMRFMADVTARQGHKQEPIGFVTSSTYASRAIEAAHAGISYGNRQFGVALYGRSVLRELGAPVPAELPLNQVPGDLRENYENLRAFEADLTRL